MRITPSHLRRCGWPSLALAGLLSLLPGCVGDSSRDAAGDDPAEITESRLLMGTTFAIRLVATDEGRARQAIDSAFEEVARVEALLSEWRETSEISELNRRSGEGPVEVGSELLEVVARSIEASEQTDGAFDISFAACAGLWSFSRERVPSDAELAECLAAVDYRRIEVDEARSTIELPRAGMRIGIAGIGKGYGVDRAAEVLEANGFHDYFVDGGGDIRVGGTHGERPWKVGIADPRRPGELLGAVAVGHGAIVTSGDYQNFFERDGVRYHHILDPRTGSPAREAIAVTVIAPSATDADALATGLFVLGPVRGLEVAEAYPGVEALIIDGNERVVATSGFPAWDRVAGGG